MLLQPTGTTALRFASAYGFRNIQTLLRKIKQGVCQYDYVEIMACPAGCTNGGGQIKPGAGESAQTVIAQVEAAYHQPVKSSAVSANSPLLTLCCALTLESTPASLELTVETFTAGLAPQILDSAS